MSENERGVFKGANNIEAEVLNRYRDGAEQVEEELCCPTEYESDYLDVIPEEVIEKDYGCGDPSRHAKEGDTVIDLGSGTGKICYILSQKVGQEGDVLGIDFNDDMLSLARKYKDGIAAEIGYDNVRFRKGKIQDLALDLGKAESYLKENPVSDLESLSDYEAECERLRSEEPLVESDSVDLIVSNCVLNLVRDDEKKKLFDEMHRVLNRGGRAVISDIVCDEEPTEQMKQDPELWSGCISGAFREDQFLKMFEEAGLYGVEILNRQEEPWKVIDGIEFRSMTVRAYKGKEGVCLERNQAVIYRGPWKMVVDDDGHKLYRGERMAVCDKTYKIYTDPNGPYHEQIEPIPPRESIPHDEADVFDCGTRVRHPRETKGEDYRETDLESSEIECCDDDTACC